MKRIDTKGDVIIVGGGIIGCSIAFYLARQGVSVLLLEQGRVGREASWASAGILTHGNPTSMNPYQKLATLSRSLFGSLVEELCQLTGVDSEYRPIGGLHVFLGEEEAEEAKQHCQQAVSSGVEAEYLDAKDLAALEPTVGQTARGGVRFKQDASIRNPRLVRALALAVQRLGGGILEYSPVVDFEIQLDRVKAAITPQGRVEGNRFVLATGAWSGLVGKRLGVNLPVYPSKGQMVLLESLPGRLSQVVHAEGRYLVPRLDGKLLVGATVESSGFNKSNTPQGVQELLSWALRVAPTLADARFVTSWSGLRPAARPRGPFLGRLPEFENLYVSTAHNRNGILLSPASGLVMSQLVTDLQPSVAIESFVVPS